MSAEAIYIAKLTNRKNGQFYQYVGSLDDCQACIEHNANQNCGEIYLASEQAILNEIDRLEQRWQDINSSYQYSPWAAGPAFRENLIEIRRKQERLRTSCGISLKKAA